MELLSDLLNLIEKVRFSTGCWAWISSQAAMRVQRIAIDTVNPLQQSSRSGRQNFQTGPSIASGSRLGIAFHTPSDERGIDH
jgi:hypothetical protein